MKNERKIIENKVGMLKLAQKLGNVSQVLQSLWLLER